MKKIYRGTITDCACDSDASFLFGIRTEDGKEIVLAKEVLYKMRKYGNFLTVGYFISKEPREMDDAIRAIFCPIVGDPDEDEVEFHHNYSEYTGYLWTDEDLVVGGHDLLQELHGFVGKFIHLEITFSKEQP